MVVTTDTEVTRKVFSYNDPETLLMGVSPINGQKTYFVPFP